MHEIVTVEEALEMTVRDFVEKHGYEGEFARMAYVWNQCANERLNLGIDCEEIYLDQIDD